jgi:hypothetical protein
MLHGYNQREAIGAVNDVFGYICSVKSDSCQCLLCYICWRYICSILICADLNRTGCNLAPGGVYALPGLKVGPLPTDMYV